MKRWILAALSLSLILCGCASSSYKRSTERGEIYKISLAAMLDKVQRKDTFAVMLTQTYCGYCQDFEEMLTAYLKDHDITMYNVILDEEEATPQENLELIRPVFPDFGSTPGIFYVEKGVEKSHLKPKDGEIDDSLLDEWLQEYQLDRKEESNE